MDEIIISKTDQMGPSPRGIEQFQNGCPSMDVLTVSKPKQQLYLSIRYLFGSHAGSALFLCLGDNRNSVHIDNQMDRRLGIKS